MIVSSLTVLNAHAQALCCSATRNCHPAMQTWGRLLLKCNRLHSITITNQAITITIIFHFFEACNRLRLRLLGQCNRLRLRLQFLIFVRLYRTKYHPSMRNKINIVLKELNHIDKYYCKILLKLFGLIALILFV